MSSRLRFSYSDLHQTIADGVQKIIASDFQFDVILAIGGGFIPARILRTYVEKPLIAISLARYHPDEPPSDVPHKIQWVEGVNNMITGKRVLLVDEVDDERTTLAFAIGELLAENPAEIGVFVMHNKLKTKKAEFPDLLNTYLLARTSRMFGLIIPGMHAISFNMNVMPPRAECLRLMKPKQRLRIATNG